MHEYRLCFPKILYNSICTLKNVSAIFYQIWLTKILEILSKKILNQIKSTPMTIFSSPVTGSDVRSLGHQLLFLIKFGRIDIFVFAYAK